MRPPEHWHLRRRRSNRRWWVIGGGGALILIVVLFITVCGTGGGGDSTSTSAVASATACPAEGCETSQGAEEQPPAVPISGRSAAIIEASCGALLYGQSERERLPMASLTKITTALAASDHADLNRVVEVDVNSALMVVSTDSTVMGLEPGLEMSLIDLMHGLLMVSGNDAAVEIAQEVGGTVALFIDLMNLKATELGLEDTHYSNVHGLDEPGHYTSAYDVALSGLALLEDPLLATIVAKKRYTANWDRPEFRNGNELLDLYPGVVGVKIGFTEGAKQTIVAAAEQGDRRLIVSVLGSDDRYADAIALLEWAWLNTTPACDESGSQGEQ
jgi:D-alanyl-D-alanine carboxypeptidase